MTEFERDLRDALEPLGGEPLDDRDAVLAALAREDGAGADGGPDGADMDSGRPAWLRVAAAAAAALVVGVAAGFLVGRGDTTTAEPVAGPMPGTDSDAPRAAVARVAIRRGALTLETDDGPRPLGPGDELPADHFVKTGERGLAFLELPNGTELRLDAATRLSIDPAGLVSLVAGRAWIGGESESTARVVDTVEGTIRGTGATFQVAITEAGIRAVGLDGTARLDLLTAERPLPARAVVEVDEGILREQPPLAAIWNAIDWQIEALANCSDRTEEAYDYAIELVDLLDAPDPALRADADLALRRAGPIGEWVLGVAVAERPDLDDAHRARVLDLWFDVATLQSAPFLLGTIRTDAPELRVRSAATLERVTGLPTGGDAAFWRDAPPAERYEVLRRYEQELRGR